MEAAGLALSISALFATCYEGLKLLSDAKSATTAISRTKCKFEIQRARLVTWGRGWGLLANDALITSDILEARLSIEGAAISNLIESIFSEMASILSDGHKLKGDYGLESFGAEGTSVEAQPRQSPVTRSSSSFGLIKRSRTNAPEDSKSMALLKRLSWSIRDKDRFEILVTDLRELNDGLCSILPIQTQVSYRQALNAAVLSGTDDSSKLAAIEQAAEPEYPDIANAARLRAATLGIEEGFQNQLATLQLKLPRGSVKFLAGRMASSDDVQMLGPDISGKCREFALYQGTQHGSTPSIGSSTVVVEWKPYDFQAAGAKAFSIALRADGLARLLQSSAGQADLRMLPLIGYIDDLPEARFGFIFQCPTPRLFGFPNKVKSLNWILTSSPKLPALELRFRLAQNLAKTLFAFHCAQWLHKDFSSHNIVFASRIGATEEVDSADLARPFVLGFKYSRPEDHEGLSSEIRAHESDETHLYQHPKLSALESQNSVPRYCRMFDIYALGCVLLELGLWRPLRSLWKPRYRKEPGNWRTKLVETWATELRGRCGTQYEEVVRYCLRMDEMAGSLEADELSRFCWEIVAKLQELKV